ncbi:L,D-transpeptidase family protein [Sphingomonas sp. ASV193]|uniref:L,D-transpeptidase family protein n=1 Tax=Sphingomonas sp. ASV193 TaxID=3144405 RepID=UPI0032E8CBA8
MSKLALALAASALCALTAPTAAFASDESETAIAAASTAAVDARVDSMDLLGAKSLKPGAYVWHDNGSPEAPRVVISLGDQLAYVYRGDQLIAVSTISSGKPGKDSPAGEFNVLAKEEMHRSKKYDDAPMPWMQRIDNYGIALHAGFNPGYPASHGCIRLPAAFAKKLYGITDVGTTVLIGA